MTIIIISNKKGRHISGSDKFMLICLSFRILCMADDI